MENRLFFDEEGRMYDIRGYCLTLDYVKNGRVPPVDELLDWRLMAMKYNCHNRIEQEYLILELSQVDCLLKKCGV